MKWLFDQRAQTMASGVIAVLLLIAVASALIDGLTLLSTRQRCLEIASAAALRGTSAGRDYAGYLSSGQIGLDPVAASDEAARAAGDALQALGLTGYLVRVEVLAAPGGGSVADFPPGRTWTEATPAVGVYLDVPGDTVLMQAILSAPISLRVFAAAGVETE